MCPHVSGSRFSPVAYPAHFLHLWDSFTFEFFYISYSLWFLLLSFFFPWSSSFLFFLFTDLNIYSSCLLFKTYCFFGFLFLMLFVSSAPCFFCFLLFRFYFSCFSFSCFYFSCSLFLAFLFSWLPYFLCGGFRFHGHCESRVHLVSECAHYVR